MYVQPAPIYISPPTVYPPLPGDNPLLYSDSLGRAMSDLANLNRYAGGTQLQSWNNPPLTTAQGPVVIDQGQGVIGNVQPGVFSNGVSSQPGVFSNGVPVAPGAFDPRLGGGTGNASAPSASTPPLSPAPWSSGVLDPERDRAREARERRVRLNSVYDITPDVRGSLDYLSRGSYSTSVQALRRAAVQNPDAITGAGTNLDLLIANDPAFAQQARWALGVYENPPRDALPQADALFAAAALRAMLNDRAGAIAAARASQEIEPDRISTRALLGSLDDAARLDGP